MAVHVAPLSTLFRRVLRYVAAYLLCGLEGAMSIALGVSWYARGSYDQSAQCLANAFDLAPDNPTPYLFLGKMQNVEGTPPEKSAQRLERFAQLQPGCVVVEADSRER